MSADDNTTTHFASVEICRWPYTGEVLHVRGHRGGWAQPSLLVNMRWHGEPAALNDAVYARFGLRATTLRCVRAPVTSADGARQFHAYMESADRAWRPPDDARWALSGFASDWEEIIDPDVALDRHGVERVAASVPWSMPGWRDDAMQWARSRLAEHDIHAVGEATQMRHWSISSIWRIPTNRGDAWFKAVPPMFAHEGTLIELIAPSMPEHLPRVIAADRARGWTLMEALPGGVQRDHVQWQLNTVGDEYDESLRVFARLQQAWIGREDDLLGAGCGDRRLATLTGAIDELMTSVIVQSAMSDDERARLRDFASEVPGRIEALRGCGIPETLVHGDFHRGNITLDGDRIVFFDWTDGCVGHPFFDMATFLPRDPVERAALSHAYLEAWTNVATPAQIERAWELAGPLACIHHSLSYMRILDEVEPDLRWEFDTDAAFWLRWLRDLLDVG